MLRQPSRALVALALFVAALSGCGGDEGSSPAAGTSGQSTTVAQAAIVVTRDCGKQVVVERSDVPSGQTALQALRRVAEVETESGGKLVTAIDGVEQDTGKKLAWLFYVNGEMAEKGAAEIKLSAGDVEWWDLHQWTIECPVPADAR